MKKPAESNSARTGRDEGGLRERVDPAEAMIDRVLDLEAQGRHDEAAAAACAACERDPRASRLLDDTLRVTSLLGAGPMKPRRDLTAEIIERVERRQVFLPRPPRRRPSAWRSAVATGGLMTVAVLGVMRYRTPEPPASLGEDLIATSIAPAKVAGPTGDALLDARPTPAATAGLLRPTLPLSTPYDGRSRIASMPVARLTPWIDSAEAKLWSRSQPLANATRAIAPAWPGAGADSSPHALFAAEVTPARDDDPRRAVPQWTWLIELTGRP